MKLKYNEKLDIVFDVPDELLQAETVKFMLQPIVENSIEHGVDQLPGKGIIEVKALLAQSTLILTVSDNGVGVGKERLEEIQGWLSESTSREETKRIGVRNVHDRLKLQYGESFGLEIDSKLGEGTTVTYRLPFLKGREEQSNGD